MSEFRVTQNTFTGGELSPYLIARNDLAKYANGLKSLKNGFVREEGCILNRAGLELVGEAKYPDKKVRLIPFSFNTEQTYIIEAGHKYFRFITNGGYIIYPDNYGDDENDPDKQAKKGQIVEIETPYSEDDLFLIKYAQSADVLSLTKIGTPPKELTRLSHYDWTLNDISFFPSILPPANVKAAWTGSSENGRYYTYLVTAIDAKTLEESNRSEEVSALGRYEGYWAVGEYMTITFDSVPNALEYNVYRSVNGVFGYIGTTSATSFVDDKIEPDLTSTAPMKRNPFEDENYPGVVNYFKQRKLYANLLNDPQTIKASQIAAPNNFNVSRPLLASDAISISIAEREVNEIRHLIGMSDLIVLTSSAEWRINGADGVFSASPPPEAVVQSNYGSSNVMPVVSGSQIIFVQAGGSIVRDLGYTYVSDSYDGDELSIFAKHLFENKHVVDMAYSKEPHKITWCVISDGTIAALTYNKKQEVCAWHKHTTKGNFESVAVVREDLEDAAYFAVERILNGQTKRYIERMATRLISDAKEGFFVDCGLRYNGSAIKEVSGLNHLENEEVIALADGGVIDNLKVQNGKILLPRAASKIVIGLPYEFEIETLNIEGENTHGILKSINQISIKVEKSREDFFIQTSDGTLYQNPRSIESINNAGFLFSGDIKAIIPAVSTSEATIKIKQKYPLPITILSISATVNIGDVR